MKKIFSIAVNALFFFNGCALILQGSREDIELSTLPSGAEVWVNGAIVGNTPCKVDLKRGQEYTIEFRSPDFQTKTYRITSSVGGGWIVLDVICGLIPVVIDAATGAWYEFDQTSVVIALEKK